MHQAVRTAPRGARAVAWHPGSFFRAGFGGTSRNRSGNVDVCMVWPVQQRGCPLLGMRSTFVRTVRPDERQLPPTCEGCGLLFPVASQRTRAGNSWRPGQCRRFGRTGGVGRPVVGRSDGLPPDSALSGRGRAWRVLSGLRNGPESALPASRAAGERLAHEPGGTVGIALAARPVLEIASSPPSGRRLCHLGRHHSFWVVAQPSRISLHARRSPDLTEEPLFSI